VIPRLRLLFVTPESRVLVIDRAGEMSPDRAQTMARIASVGKIDGTMVFPFEVDIPEDTDGIEVHADEREALRSAISLLRSDVRVSQNVTMEPNDGLTQIADTLDLLLTRIEERL